MKWFTTALALLVCTVSAQAQVLNPANGHYYMVVSSGRMVSWYSAKDSASRLTFRDFRGHLATIESKAESDFIKSNVSVPVSSIWLGGARHPGAVGAFANWQWITGEPFEYTDWRPGEPSNDRAVTDALEMDANGMWNDRNAADRLPGYMVEFESDTVSVTRGVPVSWDAKGWWVDTGLYVTAGDTIRVHATGTWSAYESQRHDAGGSRDARWFDQFLNPYGQEGIGAIVNNVGALIGYIGDTPPAIGSYQNMSVLQRKSQIARMVLLGSDIQVTAPISGRLYLGMNDDAYCANSADNSGSVTATVSITRCLTANFSY